MIPLSPSLQYHRFASYAWGRVSWTLLRICTALRFTCGVVIAAHSKINDVAGKCNERAAKHVQGIQNWIDREGL